MYKKTLTVGYLYDKELISDVNNGTSMLDKLDIEYRIWTDDNFNVEIRIDNKDDIKKFCEEFDKNLDYSGIELLVIYN